MRWDGSTWIDIKLQINFEEISYYLQYYTLYALVYAVCDEISCFKVVWFNKQLILAKKWAKSCDVKVRTLTYKLFIQIFILQKSMIGGTYASFEFSFGITILKNLCRTIDSFITQVLLFGQIYFLETTWSEHKRCDRWNFFDVCTNFCDSDDNVSGFQQID